MLIEVNVCIALNGNGFAHNGSKELSGGLNRYVQSRGVDHGLNMRVAVNATVAVLTHVEEPQIPRLAQTLHGRVALNVQVAREPDPHRSVGC